MREWILLARCECFNFGPINEHSAIVFHFIKRRLVERLRDFDGLWLLGGSGGYGEQEQKAEYSAT